MSSPLRNNPGATITAVGGDLLILIAALELYQASESNFVRRSASDRMLKSIKDQYNNAWDHTKLRDEAAEFLKDLNNAVDERGLKDSEIFKRGE
jgi:hypothetical protein